MISAGRLSADEVIEEVYMYRHELLPAILAKASRHNRTSGVI